MLAPRHCPIGGNRITVPHRWREAFDAAKKVMPRICAPLVRGRNGEELATDEAAVWKRTLNYRIAAHLQPAVILETHPGFAVSTAFYAAAAPRAALLRFGPDCNLNQIDLIDIDPFGQPWDTIAAHAAQVRRARAVLVSNGEAYAVVRRWGRAQRFPSKYYGREMPRWVVTEYLPRLEKTLGMPCRFFYVFPTTVRSIHSPLRLPRALFAGCPQWMRWLKSCAPDAAS
jgi:hypothetical protein